MIEAITVASLTCNLNEIKQKRAFIDLLHPYHLLCDVLTSGAHTPHSQEDVVLQEIPGQDLKKHKLFTLIL